MEPARVEGSPSGQRPGPPTPGEDIIPSPDEKSFHSSTTPTTRVVNGDPPGRCRPARCGSACLLADCRLAGAHGINVRREFPLGPTSRSRRSRRDEGPIPGSEMFPYLNNLNNAGPKTDIPRVNTSPPGVEAPTLLADCRLAGDHGINVRRESPLGPTSRSRRSRRDESPIPRSEIFPYLNDLNNAGPKTNIPRVNTAPHGVNTPSYWLIADWLGLMEPARGASCPLGQRRGRAAHGEVEIPFPDQKSFHISTTPTTPGRKWRSPGSIPFRTVWKP